LLEREVEGLREINKTLQANNEEQRVKMQAALSELAEKADVFFNAADTIAKKDDLLKKMEI